MENKLIYKYNENIILYFEIKKNYFLYLIFNILLIIIITKYV